MRVGLSLLLLALLLVLQYQLWIGDGSLGHRAELQHQIELQNMQNQKLEARNEVIINEIQVLTDGTEGLEEIARSKLGMIGEDETFYLIPNEAEQRTGDETPPADLSASSN